MDSTDQIAIDKDYTSPALALIRKVLKGNGVRMDAITIKHFDGAILNFTATTRLTLNDKIVEKTVIGKATGGTIFQNRQAAHNEAKNYASTAWQDPAIANQIKELINQQPYHGFGLDNQTIKLPFLNRDFINHESCNPCHGKGQVQCAKCNGKGSEPCPHCNAQGFEQCHECNGNRQIRNPQGQMQSCHQCHGLGKISCSFCKESRQVQCRICQTKGEIQCKTCSGKGSQSNVISISITAQCTYDFETDSLPEKAISEIKKLGASLADQAQVTLVNKDNEENKQEALHIFYEIIAPQGSIEFTIKDQTVPAYLFGKKGTIKEIPDFLDSIITPGIKKLEQAASGKGDISKNIHSAIRYKTVRQALIAAARYNSKKSIKALLHYTPLGLSTRTAQNLIENANIALNNMTKKQRTMAIIYGSSSGAILGALYFLSPLRPALLTQINNAALHTPINLIILGLCAAAGYGVWQTLSSQARKQALKSFIPSKK